MKSDCSVKIRNTYILKLIENMFADPEIKVLGGIGHRKLRGRSECFVHLSIYPANSITT